MGLRVQGHKTIILTVVLCGCETWPVTLKPKHKLLMFEDMELQKISRPNWGEVTGDGRRRHSEDFHTSCSSWNVNRMIKSLRMI